MIIIWYFLQRVTGRCRQDVPWKQDCGASIGESLPEVHSHTQVIIRKQLQHPPCQKVTSCLRRICKKHLLKSMHLSLASDFSFRSSMWAIWVWIIHALSSKKFLYKTDIALKLLLRKKRFYQEVSDVKIYWTDIIKDNNSITDVFIKLCLHSRNVRSNWKLILILSSSR